MILGVMQPYFFPYLGYFELIARSDRWVVFDIVNFQPKSWMIRNRILHPNSGWQYVNVNTANGSQNRLIKDIILLNPNADSQKIAGQLTHYKKKAPFYAEVSQILKRAFANLSSASLTDINVAAITEICCYLDISFEPILASSLNINTLSICHPGQWSLEISTLLGASMYINPPGGKDIFKPEEFKARNIKLAFTRMNDFKYECPGYTFEPNLSIIDVMMWNDPKDIKAVLTRQNLEYAC